MIDEIVNFRKKYPDYNDINDSDLASMLANKYPDAYGDLPEKLNVKESLDKEAAETFAQPEQTNTDNLKQAAMQQLKVPEAEVGMSLATGAAASIAGGLTGIGTLVGGIRYDPGTGVSVEPGTLEKAGRNVEKVIEAGTYQPRTEGGKRLLGRASKPLELLHKGATAAGDPIAEAGFPKIAGVVATGIEALPLLLGKKVSPAKSPGAVLKNIASKTKRTVINSFNQAVKPSIKGKRTAGAVNAYNDKTATAINKIVENKESLSFMDESGTSVSRLPQSLNDLQSATAQTMKKVFAEYDALAKSTEGNMVSGAEAVSGLGTVLENKALKIASPETLSYAKNRIKAFEMENFTAAEAQEAIQILNKSLEAFYRDPSGATYGRSLVDSLIANNMRKSLDTAIKNATGKEYQALKRDYGALKTIEEDVARASNRERNKVTGSTLPNFSDIFAGHQVIHGLASLDISTILAGIGTKGLSSWGKYLRNPNRQIKNMFEAVDSYHGQIKAIEGRRKK